MGAWKMARLPGTGASHANILITKEAEELNLQPGLEKEIGCGVKTSRATLASMCRENISFDQQTWKKS